MFHYTNATIQQFPKLLRYLEEDLLKAERVEVDTWHAQDVTGNPDLISREIRHVILETPIPSTQADLIDAVKPNLPWAEDHFQERISGEPLNPPPSEAYWPFAVQGNARHKDGEVFSHTYPERYWPKYAAPEDVRPGFSRRGIRYAYGDLNDVLVQLQHHPLTRQAYLPVWFPEDTGAVSHQRVPCSLGYHFLQRNGKIDVDYFIRSCDLMRHFSDDVYMTARLLQWVCNRVNDAEPGNLVMHIGSLHIFEGDVGILQQKHRTANQAAAHSTDLLNKMGF